MPDERIGQAHDKQNPACGERGLLNQTEAVHPLKHAKPFGGFLALARLTIRTLSCTPRQTCSDRQRPNIPKAEQDQHNQDGDKSPNLWAAGQCAERDHHLRTETECKDA